MWTSRDAEMRRVAAALGVEIDEERWPLFVDAASLGSMRSRAQDTAPNADSEIWRSPERFFRAGGTRNWHELLGDDDLAHFDHRLNELAGDAASWVLQGRAGIR
jgi:hypothetical protein